VKGKKKTRNGKPEDNMKRKVGRWVWDKQPGCPDEDAKGGSGRNRQK